MTRKGFTLIELLVVIVIIGILVAIALPNFIKIKDKAKEAEVKQNCHAIQLALERYAVDCPGSFYPKIIMGGDWTDTYVVWQSWVDMQANLDPANIVNPDRRDRWEPAEQDVGDALVMESYMPSYPGNPFMRTKTETLLPTIGHHDPDGNTWERVVGGRESSKMWETFGPADGALQSIVGDFYVHHIFNNPPYDWEGDIFKDPDGGWTSPSGNKVLVGNFSYYARQEDGGFGWIFVNWFSECAGYTLAGYGANRTGGQDVYNRNGNYKGRYRTEACSLDCGSNVMPDIPCICAEDYPPTIAMNNGGSDTIIDGVVITLDSGVDKKSGRVNTSATEGEGLN